MLGPHGPRRVKCQDMAYSYHLDILGALLRSPEGAA